MASRQADHIRKPVRRRKDRGQPSPPSTLAFAYVEPGLAVPGSRVEIEILGERRKAEVLAEPAYDPTNQRLKT